MSFIEIYSQLDNACGWVLLIYNIFHFIWNLKLNLLLILFDFKFLLLLCVFRQLMMQIWGASWVFSCISLSLLGIFSDSFHGEMKSCRECLVSICKTQKQNMGRLNWLSSRYNAFCMLSTSHEIALAAIENYFTLIVVITQKAFEKMWWKLMYT